MSPAFSITSDQFISVLKGLGIALAGAALTYLTSYFSHTDFGAYTPIVVAVWSTVVNFARKYVPTSE